MKPASRRLPVRYLNDVLPAGAVDVDVRPVGQLVRPLPRVLLQLLLGALAEEERGGVGGEGVVLEQLTLLQAAQDPVRATYIDAAKRRNRFLNPSPSGLS